MEMIVYVAIFSILFTVILNLFWRVQLSGARFQVSGEVKENASQVMQLVISSVRNGNSIDASGSVFDLHPGILVINDLEPVTFDTYEKNVNVGGQMIPIRKLRMAQGGNPSIDITSDHVDVTNYVISNLTPPGHPNTVQINLELSSINPDNDPEYDNRLSLKTSVTIREEL